MRLVREVGDRSVKFAPTVLMMIKMAIKTVLMETVLPMLHVPVLDEVDPEREEVIPERDQERFVIMVLTMIRTARRIVETQSVKVHEIVLSAERYVQTLKTMTVID